MVGCESNKGAGFATTSPDKKGVHKRLRGNGGDFSLFKYAFEYSFSSKFHVTLENVDQGNHLQKLQPQEPFRGRNLQLLFQSNQLMEQILVCPIVGRNLLVDLLDALKLNNLLRPKRKTWRNAGD